MVQLRAKVAVFAVAVAVALSAGCRAVVGTVPPSGPEAPSVPTVVPVPASGVGVIYEPATPGASVESLLNISPN